MGHPRAGRVVNRFWKRSFNDRFFVFLSFFVSFSDHFKNNRFKNLKKRSENGTKNYRKTKKRSFFKKMKTLTSLRAGWDFREKNFKLLLYFLFFQSKFNIKLIWTFIQENKTLVSPFGQYYRPTIVLFQEIKNFTFKISKAKLYLLFYPW